MGKIKVRIKVIGQTSARSLKFDARTTVADLLSKIDQNRETVVVRLNGKIIAEEEGLKSGDLIEILPIVTGG